MNTPGKIAKSGKCPLNTGSLMVTFLIACKYLFGS
jgi:hypothetical protein